MLSNFHIQVITSNEKLSRAVLDRLLEEESIEELQSYIKARVSNESFLKSIEIRNELRSDLKELESKYAKLKNLKETVSPPKNISTLLRKATLEVRDKFESLNYVQAKLDSYRALTAEAAERLSNLEFNEGLSTSFMKTYDSEIMGDLKSTGYFESGTKEWLEQRTTGVGGSDVGPILKVGPVEWRSLNLSKVRDSKLSGDSEVNPETHDYTTAIGRGNAWENAVLIKFGKNHPELQVGYSKNSWENPKATHRKCNFDGLILDKSGKAVGIVEIKTSSNSLDWGPVSGGLDSVPAGYRKQVLWYAANAGLKFGYICVLIDDVDYREYFFEINDELKEEINEIFEKTDAFWLGIEEEKKSASKVSETVHRKRTFGAMRKLDSVSEIAAIYTGGSAPAIKKEIVKEFKVDSGSFSELTENEIHHVISEVFSKFNPRNSNMTFIGIDIETTSASPRKGRIIETGIVKMIDNEVPEIVYRSRHSVPTLVSEGPGIRFEEVHNLSVSDLEGQPAFEDDEVQKEILGHLKSGIVVAHNAGFEDRFLRANLSGYSEARDSGEIKLLDTRTLTSYLMPESFDNSLESFAEDNGVPYEGAHSAAVDAYMMMVALQNLRKNIFDNGGLFFTEEITEDMRSKAKTETDLMELTR